jgi:hypothetical protein
MNIGTLLPCFSIYFSSRNPKNVQKLLRNPYLSTIIQIENEIPAFSYLLCALHVKNQRMTSNKCITWSFRLTLTMSMASSADWLDYLRAVNDGMISTNFISCTQISPLRIFISRNPSLRNTAVLLVYNVCTFVISLILQRVAYFFFHLKREGRLWYLYTATCSIQGEHKNTPRFQVVIKSKLTGIFL